MIDDFSISLHSYTHIPCTIYQTSAKFPSLQEQAEEVSQEDRQNETQP